MDRPPIELFRPPLPFVLSASPHQAAGQLVSAFATVAAMPDRVGWVHRAVMHEIGPPTDTAERAMADAGTAIAAAVDAEAAANDRHPYHNRQHYCEVMLAAHFLCRWHDLPTRAARLVLLAALVHDLDHDGRPGRDFELERRSLARAAPFLDAAGVDPATRAALAALVLATEPRQGVAAAVAAQARHLRGRSGPPVDLPLAALAPLADDAVLARAAVILCEADVLPSVGLTPEHAMRLQDRLSQEWGCPLGREDKLLFIDAVIGAGIVGAFFLPNVRALRASLAGATHAQRR